MSIHVMTGRVMATFWGTRVSGAVASFAAAALANKFCDSLTVNTDRVKATFVESEDCPFDADEFNAKLTGEGYSVYYEFTKFDESRNRQVKR